ncbi:MAG: NosD domain-containing protein, partial [Candidatus Thorarchaeota archaeon]
MGQDVKNQTRFCQIPQGSKKALNLYSRPNRMLVAVSLITILSMTALSTYLFWLPLDGGDGPIIDYGFITIDGDANFTATALLKGWPGDGSPEDPFIIDGLDIDISGEFNHCISISNTRASFIISNCSLTSASLGMGWGAGIFLQNVANGELVNNTCHGHDSGIYLLYSDSNTVANNMFVSNGVGSFFVLANYNTVADNTYNSNYMDGIYLDMSHFNTIADN